MVLDSKFDITTKLGNLFDSIPINNLVKFHFNSTYPSIIGRVAEKTKHNDYCYSIFIVTPDLEGMFLWIKPLTDDYFSRKILSFERISV